MPNPTCFVNVKDQNTPSSLPPPPLTPKKENVLWLLLFGKSRYKCQEAALSILLEMQMIGCDWPCEFPTNSMWALEAAFLLTPQGHRFLETDVNVDVVWYCRLKCVF